MYFKGQTKDQAAAHLKELAKLHHPLKGGDRQTWQAINEEFNSLTFEVPAPQPAPEDEPEQDEQPTPDSVPTCVLNAAKAARTCEGLKVELIGNWCWVTGDTRAHWLILKNAGFYYSKKKDACYYHDPADKFKKRTGRFIPHDEVKERYGVKELF